MSSVRVVSLKCEGLSIKRTARGLSPSWAGSYGPRLRGCGPH
jgi:hypothetical protein